MCKYFAFEQVDGDSRLLCGLRANISDVARRLHLALEAGHSDQFGPVADEVGLPELDG